MNKLKRVAERNRPPRTDGAPNSTDACADLRTRNVLGVLAALPPDFAHRTGGDVIKAERTVLRGGHSAANPSARTLTRPEASSALCVWAHCGRPAPCTVRALVQAVAALRLARKRLTAEPSLGIVLRKPKRQSNQGASFASMYASEQAQAGSRAKRDHECDCSTHGVSYRSKLRVSAD